jgi:hypothetical protein
MKSAADSGHGPEHGFVSHTNAAATVRAPMMHYLTDVRSEPYAAPSAAALGGLTAISRDIENLARATRTALSTDALDTEVGGRGRSRPSRRA